MNAPSATVRESRIPWVLAALAVWVIGVAMRAWVHFSHALPGGMDAGYYPLQARTLLEQGRLMYNDLPLIFVLDAALARLLIVFGFGIGDATLLASQLVDCVSQPLAGLAIFALAHSFSRGRRAMIPGAAAAAMLATFSLPAMRMVADFEKNALALAMMAGTLWAARRILDAMPGKRLRGGAVLVVLATLIAVTHIGALGATVVTLGAVAASTILASGRVTLSRLAMWLLGGVAACSVLLVAVATADVDRAKHLLRAPVKLVQQPALGGLLSMIREGPLRMGPPGRPTQGGGRPAPPSDRDRDGLGPPGEHGPMDNGDPLGFDGPPSMDGPPDGDAVFASRRGGPGAIGGPARPRGMPGARGVDPVSLFTFGAVYLLMPAGLIVLWVRRHQVPKADAAIVVGSAVGAMILACPLINGEYFMRFVLMSPVPGSIVVAYMLCGLNGLERYRSRFTAAAAAAVLAIVPVVVGTPGLLRVRVADEAVPELKALARFAPDAAGAGHTLVVAPHGLQYWAGHFMHAAGRLDRVPDDAREKYQRVFVLQQRGGGVGSSPGGGPGRRQTGPGGPGGGMVLVPDDAVRIFRGDYFTLWEVPVRPR